MWCDSLLRQGIRYFVPGVSEERSIQQTLFLPARSHSHFAVDHSASAPSPPQLALEQTVRDQFSASVSLRRDTPLGSHYSRSPGFGLHQGCIVIGVALLNSQRLRVTITFSPRLHGASYPVDIKHRPCSRHLGLPSLNQADPTPLLSQPNAALCPSPAGWPLTSYLSCLTAPPPLALSSVSRASSLVACCCAIATASRHHRVDSFAWFPDKAEALDHVEVSLAASTCSESRPP